MLDLLRPTPMKKVCFLFNSECRSLSFKREGPSAALLKPQFLKTKQVFFLEFVESSGVFLALKRTKFTDKEHVSFPCSAIAG